MTVEPVTRIKSGRASRLKFRAIPLTAEEKRNVDDKKFEGQRVFSAWVAAVYTFAMMFLGNIMAFTIIFRPTSILVTVFLATIIMLLLIPAFLISKIVYERVYGYEV